MLSIVVCDFRARRRDILKGRDHVFLRSAA
jgi:hypothetical protein